MDRTGNEPGGKGTKKYIDRKDRAWTGVAMDIKDTSAGEKSVVGIVSAFVSRYIFANIICFLRFVAIAGRISI